MLRKLESAGFITNYNRFRKNLPRKLPKKVFIWDETLREGTQTPTCFLTATEKIKLAKVLDEIGVSIIVVGFPAISEEEKRTVRLIVNQDFEQAVIAAPARILRRDIDACIEAGIKEIPIFTAFNELHMRYRLKMTPEQILEKTVESIEYAKAHGITVDFVLQDASRTPLNSIIEIFEAAIKAGAEKLVLADTVGFLRPLSMKYLVSNVKKSLEKAVGNPVSMAVHCHNDFGLATANTLAAVEEGVSYVQTCVAGFGERAGAAPLEEVVMALETLYNIKTVIKTERFHRLALMAEKYFAVPIPIHKPLVGENAFSHESGIHIHGMLVHPLSYEPIPPKLVGRKTTFYLGRQTGKHFVENRLAQAGMKASPQQIEEIVRRVKAFQETRDKGEIQMIFYQVRKLMREMRKGITDEDFWKIVKEVTGKRPRLKTRIKR